MDAPDRGDAIGRCRQLRSDFLILRCAALQRQQAHDHLQAVQQAMIGLLAQERLVLDQIVLLTKQSVFPDESLSQPGFRALMSYQLAFVGGRGGGGCEAPEIIVGTGFWEALLGGSLIGRLASVVGRSSRPCGARDFEKWHSAAKLPCDGEYSMVILSFFPVSRLRCLDTPD